MLSNKDCSSKFRSKQSSNTVLCLLRNLLEQSLVNHGLALISDWLYKNFPTLENYVSIKINSEYL